MTRFAPWRSPNGIPLRVAAAWARWAGSDLTSSLTPNGRFLDFRGTSPGQSRRPVGVMKRSYVNALYFSGSAAGLSGPSAPLLVQNGWTDDLFPVREALRIYKTYRRGHAVKLELLGRDPDFVRTSNNRFRIAVSRLRVELPTR